MFNSLFKWFLHKQVKAFGTHYDYPVDYMHEVVEANPWAMYKFSKIMGMSNHRKSISVEPYYVAKLRAILFDDCGPCTQLAVSMATEAGVSDTVLEAVVAGQLDNLAEETALVVRFTDAVMRHDPVADDMRERIVELWGMDGLISLSFVISSSRVYPAMKYTLGYGKACHRINVGEASVVANANLEEFAT